MNRPSSRPGAPTIFYKAVTLGGQRDQSWAGWSAAYLLIRLGVFAPPGNLTRWLEASRPDRHWNPRSTALTQHKLTEN